MCVHKDIKTNLCCNWNCGTVCMSFKVIRSRSFNLFYWMCVLALPFLCVYLRMCVCKTDKSRMTHQNLPFVVCFKEVCIHVSSGGAI